MSAQHPNHKGGKPGRVVKTVAARNVRIIADVRAGDKTIKAIAYDVECSTTVARGVINHAGIRMMLVSELERKLLLQTRKIVGEWP